MIRAFISWAASSEFVSSSIPSWQIVTAHAQPFRGARDLAFCLKTPLDSLLVWASSGGSGETARVRRLAWTFAARIGDKHKIRLTRPSCKSHWTFQKRYFVNWQVNKGHLVIGGPMAEWLKQLIFSARHLTTVSSSLARVIYEISQALLVGGQVVFLGYLPFSPHPSINLAQKDIDMAKSK